MKMNTPGKAERFFHTAMTAEKSLQLAGAGKWLNLLAARQKREPDETGSLSEEYCRY
ncbi:hypothetical protein [Erwinia sp. 198]|uniref:hypothetical protein n=1 Tax=Erwinia sp. 198 TaxID=2022746 RepID=UPI0013158FF2|nr:hypothetical protein [Erwinia sp. 198]